MPSLEMRLLGPPVVEIDGEPLDVDTRKAVALLAYLAVTGRPHPRDALSDLLWPDSDPGSARAAFRRTLSVLRKGLGDRWLVTTRGSVALAPDSIELDVASFRELLARRRTAEAVALVRGDFMAGFGLRDSAAFDDWQLQEEQALRRELGAALERLAEECAERGELDAAVGHAQRRLTLDPLQEGSHRLLITLYAASGRRADALEQYRECVRVLDRELGVAPLAETSELYRAVLGGSLPAARTPPPSPPGAGPALLPFAGRETEWRALSAALAGVEHDGRLVVIEGEAGLGKTRLTEELVAHARSQGMRAIAVRCHEGEAGLAYGVVIEALRAAAGDAPAWSDGVTARWLAEAGRLAPELTDARPGIPRVPPLDTPGAQSAFLDGVTRVLCAACHLLVVDDVHWADEASLDLLAYLVRRLRGRPVCLALTWRSSEIAEGNRLRLLAAEAERAGDAVLVALSPIDRAAVGELVSAAVPEPDAELTERVYAETGGVPLFVVEYLAAIEDAGSTEAVPHGLVELMRARLTPIGEAARQVLAAAAVVGGAFDLDVARETSGRSDDEAVTALEELMRRGLVTESSDGYAFAHERLRWVVYDDLSLARRRLLHRRAAETLAGHNRRDPGRAAIVAEHYRLAGRDREAAEQFRLAGDHARGLFANAEAAAHYRSALALGHPDTSGLNEAIGDAETLLGNYRAALLAYETSAATAPAHRLPQLEHKLGLLHHRRGDWQLAASHFEAALAALEDPGPRARVLADMGLNEYRRGNLAHAAGLAEEALASATAANDRLALAQAHNMVGVLAARQGDLERAHSHLEQSLERSRALPDPSIQVAALNNLALAAQAAGEPDRALELAQAALELCTAQGDRHREAALNNTLADLLHAAGREEESMERLKQAVAIFAEVGADAEEAQPEIWKLVEW